MYCEFFHLERLPFNNTPDPRFFFNTPDHEEALASLIYAAEQRKGFALVTGEVGSGKTLLSRLLLTKLGATVKTAVINNTRLTGVDLLRGICREFAVNIDEATTHAEVCECLEEFLLEQYSRDKLAVVVLDEAQNLPLETFEELRMLGNLEADDAKLLQVLILGQPELQDAFRQPSMRQLHQRVFRTFHLRALSRELTEGYIKHRLQVAGLPKGEEVFNREALDAVFKHSEGIPRLVNQICDNTMLAAYTESSKQITPRLVDEVVDQMMALTAVAAKPKTRGAFARHALGLDERSEAAASSPLRRPPSAAETPRTLGDDAFVGRFQELDRMIMRLADRLEASERTLASAEQERDRASDERSGMTTEIEAVREARNQLNESLRRSETQTASLQSQVRQLLDDLRNFSGSQQSRASEATAQQQVELEEVRRARQQADQILTESRNSIRQAEERLRQLVEEAKKASSQVHEHAAQTLCDTERETAALQAQAKHALTEVHAYAKGQQNQLSDMLSQQRAEFEAVHQMRRQTSDLLTEVTRATKQADERVRALLDDARQKAENVEKQAAASLAETEQQNSALRQELTRLLDALRARDEQNSTQVVQLAAEHRKEIESTKLQLETLQKSLNQQEEEISRRGTETLAQVQTQVSVLTERMEHLRQKTEVGLNDVSVALDKATSQTRSRIEDLYRQLSEAATNARTEIQTARDAFHAGKEQMIAEMENGRVQMSGLLEETRDVLLKTKEHAGGLLADLRTQVADQTHKAERFWQTATAESAKLLNEVHSKLSETRLLGDQSRAELEGLVRDTMSEIANARTAFEAGLNSHKAEIAKLSNDATAIKTDIARRFEDARKELDAVLVKYHDSLRQRTIKMIAETDDSVAAAQTKAGQTVESLRGQLKSASDTAERIYTELQRSLAALQHNAAECRAQYESEATRMQRELPELVDRNRRLLDDAQARVETTSQQAVGAVEQLRGQIEELKDSARNSVAGIGQELDSCIEQAVTDSEKLRAETETIAANLADRMNQTRRKAEVATAHAEKAVNSIREQGRSSLGEVRTALGQMSKRSELVQQDLARVKDEIAASAKTSCQQLHDAAGSVTEQIQSLREAAQRDADANQRRLSALREQVEQGAEQIRQNANKLLDQVQTGASSLREHANELLANAQGGADKIGEQAASLLMQAHASAERFREQAETLLRRSEAISEAVRNDVGAIRGDILRETKEVREQIAGARHELVESKSESRQLLDEARDLQTQTQRRGDDLLKHAEQIKDRSEALLSLPKQIVEEASQRASALADMSKKVSGVVQQLANAGEEASRNKNMLEQANNSANDTVDLLKRHTARVGQLVGIIRQLYGSMDARIEGLRNRLEQADVLCRGVPGEIDKLREALDISPTAPLRPVEAKTGEAAHAKTDRTPGVRADKPPQRATPRPLPSPVGANANKPAATPKATQQPAVLAAGAADKRALGQIAERHKKLNEWLREVLNEEAIPGPPKPAVPPNRVDQSVPVKK
jgi:general secretion pathway protein A